jgi:hypothetical protein
LSQSKVASGQHSPVPGNDPVIGIDKNGIAKAELGDAGGDLCDLFIRMGARVASIRDQFLDRPQFYV